MENEISNIAGNIVLPVWVFITAITGLVGAVVSMFMILRADSKAFGDTLLKISIDHLNTTNNNTTALNNLGDKIKEMSDTIKDIRK